MRLTNSGVVLGSIYCPTCDRKVEIESRPDVGPTGRVLQPRLAAADGHQLSHGAGSVWIAGDSCPYAEGR